MSDSITSEGGDSMDKKSHVRKIRVHKLRPATANPDSIKLNAKLEQDRNAEMDRRIAELIPGIAELSVSSAAMSTPSSGALATAADVRKRQQLREEAHRAEVLELNDIYDMSVPNKVDLERPPEGAWSQELRPRVRKIVLSPYQVSLTRLFCAWGGAHGRMALT